MAKQTDQSLSVSTPIGRFAKLAGLSAKVVRKVAAQKVKGLFQSESEQIRQRHLLMEDLGAEVASTLGQMKGAVMKVGQIASQLKDFFPSEIAVALESLQRHSPPMPFTVIEQQIVSELGRPLTELFSDLSKEPCAAASIGQVHRATLIEGQEVVIKVQYPNVRECCDADLKHLKNLFRLVGLLKVDGAALDGVFDEIRKMLYEELDYEKEAKNLESFQQYYKQDATIIIPQLYAEYSSKQVLTLSYEPGVNLNQVSRNGYSQEQLNGLGARLLQLVCEQMFKFKLLHSDPNPGNFAIGEQDELIVYDFGAVKPLTDQFVDDLKRLLQVAIDRDVPGIESMLFKRGIRRPGSAPLGADFYTQWLDLLLAPMKVGYFDFGTSDLHEAVLKKAKKDMFKNIDYFQPNRESVHVDRVFTGHYWNLVRLGACVEFSAIVEQYAQIEARVDLQ